MTHIHDNIRQIEALIADACGRANRSPQTVTLLAVSKQQSVADVLTALDCGIRHFGENRLEEAVEKIAAVNSQAPYRPTWHMIGTIQSRKAKLTLPLFDVIQTVDRLKLAEKLSELASASQRIVPIMLEVNISGEASKQGFNAYQWQTRPELKAVLWQELEAILALPNLEIRGLMTMAPHYEDAERTRPVFAALAELREVLRQRFNSPLPDLSMGMSNDFPIAIEEGATIVRIGRAIFANTHP